MSTLFCARTHFQNVASYVSNKVAEALHIRRECLNFDARTNSDLREIIAKGQSVEEFRQAVVVLRERYFKFHDGKETFVMPEELEMFNLAHPPWICQPYVRPPPDVYLEKMRRLASEERKERAEGDENKRGADNESDEAQTMSKTKRKKMEKKAQKDKWKTLNQMKIDYQSCSAEDCNNPCSKKCESLLCKRCCKTKSETQIMICEAHKIYVRNLKEGKDVETRDS